MRFGHVSLDLLCFFFWNICISVDEFFYTFFQIFSSKLNFNDWPILIFSISRKRNWRKIKAPYVEIKKSQTLIFTTIMLTKEPSNATYA
jgi:hypothetical protein